MENTKNPLIKKTECYLKYSFTEKEMKEHAQQLARENQEIEKIEREKAQVVSAYSARTKEATAKISRFAGYIREGYDMRMIPCEVRLDVPVKGTKTVVRLDTGEFVKEERMDSTELQNVFDFEKKEKREAKAKDGKLPLEQEGDNVHTEAVVANAEEAAPVTV